MVVQMQADIRAASAKRLGNLVLPSPKVHLSGQR